MNILLVYFSQTGNTRKVAETMAEAFRDKGHTVRSLSIKEALPEDIKGCEVMGIGTPCFESQAPTPVKNFLRALPPLYGKPAFVFATSGGMPGRVLYDLTSIIQKKGASVLAGFMGRGTVHHPAPCIMGRMPGRPNQEDLGRARLFAESLLKHLQTAQFGPMPEGRKDALTLQVGFYELVALIAQPFLLRILLPKPKIDQALCNQCGICDQECPMQSITLNPYPVLDGRCIRCYHCQNICPQTAISSSWLLGNIVIFSLYNTLFARLFGDVEPDERIY
jgi:flavodoxin/ferredoxin